MITSKANACFSLVLCFFTVLSGCGSDDVADASNNLASPDTAMDMRSDGSISSDGGQDSSDLVSMDVGSLDASDHGPPLPVILPRDDRNVDGDELIECNCPDSEDACTVSGACAKSDRFCADDSECPDGYACNDDDYCVCQGQFPECNALCEFDEECPFIWGCLDSGRCSATSRGCFNELHCPLGQVCHSVVLGPNNEREVCDTPGPKEAGENCETGYECSSGSCLEGVCATSCRRNGDCPDGVGCNQELGYCLGERLGDCGDDAYVFRLEICASQFCSHSADCGPETDCVMSATYNELGYCPDESTAVPCKPGETTLPLFPDLCWSMSEQGCTPESCDSPYYCFSDHNQSNTRPQCVRER